MAVISSTVIDGVSSSMVIDGLSLSFMSIDSLSWSGGPVPCLCT